MLLLSLPSHLSRSHKYHVRVAGDNRINKSQGQSLENVGLYLPRPGFAHGQLYVALSRVGNPDWIKVLVIDLKEQGTFEGRDGVYTVKIVYPKILAHARELLLRGHSPPVLPPPPVPPPPLPPRLPQWTFALPHLLPPRPWRCAPRVIFQRRLTPVTFRTPAPAMPLTLERTTSTWMQPSVQLSGACVRPGLTCLPACSRGRRRGDWRTRLSSTPQLMTRCSTRRPIGDQRSRRTCVRPTHTQSAGLAERPRAMAHECQIGKESGLAFQRWRTVGADCANTSFRRC